MKIRLAILEDAPYVEALLMSCKAEMERNGLFQWTSAYPNSSITEDDINKRQLHVLEDDKIVGMVVFNEEQEIEYAQVKWAQNEGRILIIHRLAVDPESQGQGCARTLMDFAEDFAVENGYSSIRLDTYSENHRALKIYEKRNYQVRGLVNFKGRSAPFYCLEKETLHVN